MPPVRKQKTKETVITSWGFKRGPGRPKKKDTQPESVPSASAPTPKRGRGRPRKDGAPVKSTLSVSAPELEPPQVKDAESELDTDTEPVSAGNKKAAFAPTSENAAVSVKTKDAALPSASEPAPRQKTQPRKQAEPGVKDAYFRDNYERDERYQVLGTKTKTLKFGGGFVLSDAVIDDLLAMGQGVCRSLWDLEFTYENVSYGAKNSAKEITDEGTIRLAGSCTSLRRVRLPGTSDLGDHAILAFCDNCLQLSTLEISPSSDGRSRITRAAFDYLRDNPGTAEKLKELQIGKNDDKEFMKAMRELGRARPKLLIELISVSEEKKYGDWELDLSANGYRNGRVLEYGYKSSWRKEIRQAEEDREVAKLMRSLSRYEQQAVYARQPKRFKMGGWFY